MKNSIAPGHRVKFQILVENTNVARVTSQNTEKEKSNYTLSFKGLTKRVQKLSENSFL